MGKSDPTTILPPYLPLDLPLLMETITEHALVLLDKSARVCGWNAGAERIFGYAKEEITGGDLHLLFTPEDRSAGAPEREIRTAEAEGKAMDERWHLRKNGERFWASGILYRVQEPGGGTRGFIKVMRDISDLRQDAEALLESERKLEFFVENIPDCALFLVNRDRCIASWNRGAERLFGYAGPEVLGKPIAQLFSKVDSANGEADRELEAALAEGKSDTERLHRRKDGSLFWASAVTVPLIDREDELRGFARITRDATEKKRAEESHRMESIGRLAGGVAHDFNNMLTAINGYAELLLSVGPGESPPKEWADEIRKAGMRAAALTRQLLAFSRRQVLTPRAVSLNDIIRSTAPLLRRTLGEDIRITTELSPELETVLLDAGQFEQVLLNLALNAREAMPQGGEITLETSNVVLRPADVSEQLPLQPGEYALLKFRDQGRGMTSEVLARVFEPFFTTKSKGTGSVGLGLSTVYGVVRQSGGAVTVTSEPGRGSEFRIYLPPAKGPADTRPAPPLEAAPSSERRILLVEDENSVRRLMAQLLRREGYQVVETRDGEEAAAWLESHPEPIHLVVTDVVMPRMGGRELARRVRTLRPDAALLFMSGYTEESVLPEGTQPHVAFLQKPFPVPSLIRKVHEALGFPAQV